MSLAIDHAFQIGALAAAPFPGFGGRDGSDSIPWMAGLLDQIDYGLVVLNESGAALYFNRSAREWFGSSAAPLRLYGGHVEAVSAQDARQLDKALAGAVSRGLRALLSFGKGDDGIAAALGPIPGADAGSNLALLVLGRRQVCEALTAQLYASRHGLTFAESQVLHLLCSGMAPGEIARRQQVAVSTVRTQIGGIRAKTGAKSIGALLREVALLPPLMHSLSASAPMSLN